MSFVAKSLPTRDRDDDRGAPAPREAPVDFFLSASHDLFAIGALYRAQGEAFNRALTACSTNNKNNLTDALALVRDRAERIAVLTAALQDKTLCSDDFELFSNAYGEAQ